MYYDRFDIVTAHYLFYSHYHSGMFSTFYKRLCRILDYFKPSPLMSYDIEMHEPNVQYIYQNLVEKHGFATDYNYEEDELLVWL